MEYIIIMHLQALELFAHREYKDYEHDTAAMITCIKYTPDKCLVYLYI